VEVNLLLDTNRYRDYVQGDEMALKTLQGCQRVVISFVTLAELRCGFLIGSKSQANQRTLVRFLAKPDVELVFPDDGTLHHYAQLFVQLRRQGTPIPTNDVWIAALAVQHRLRLYSRDAHFDHLPQLDRI
jgi:predicted nucleic acid-binding protein